MGCYNCNNSINGCSSCNNNITCSQAVQPAIPCGVRPCSPAAIACACGCNPCTCDPATPTPFYSDTPQCQEDHCQAVNTYLFSTNIRTDTSFNMPICNGSVRFVSSDVVALQVGSYLWSSTYGYLEVTGFDPLNHQITAVNRCNEGNAEVGTLVTTCSEWDVVDPPSPPAPVGEGSCVAVDFTAPIEGDCILITLTTTAGLDTDDQIRIGTGTYRVDSVDSETLITICNDGEGITPGTPVIAKNAEGNYQYCISVVGNCCTTIQDRFGGILTPCSDFENLVLSDEDISEAISGFVGDGSDVISNEVTLEFINSSTCRTMIVSVNTILTLACLMVSGSTSSLKVTYSIEQKIDAGAYAAVISGAFSMVDGNVATDSNAKEVPYNGIFSVAAGATLTLKYRGRIVGSNAVGGGNAAYEDYLIMAQGIGVAV